MNLYCHHRPPGCLKHLSHPAVPVQAPAMTATHHRTHSPPPPPPPCLPAVLGAVVIPRLGTPHQAHLSFQPHQQGTCKSYTDNKTLWPMTTLPSPVQSVASNPYSIFSSALMSLPLMRSQSVARLAWLLNFSKKMTPFASART